MALTGVFDTPVTEAVLTGSGSGSTTTGFFVPQEEKTIAKKAQRTKAASHTFPDFMGGFLFILILSTFLIIWE
jgi:hypothetical protein